ncbi:MAG: SDR family oxidoreductase [Myxococcota bacterium]
MRIFITGATGYIGGAVAQRLLTAGHQVIGLARSNQSADRLKAMGAEVHRGDLGDLDSLTRGAAAAEGVVHAGFSVGDWSQLDSAFAQEQAAVEAMLSTLAGTGQPLLYTSGSGVLTDTGAAIADETVPANGAGAVALRAALEQTVLQAGKHGVRTIVIRPGLVYGQGGSGVMHMLAELARQAGGGRTVGDGHNVWSAVHVDDLADLYLSGLERGPAGTLFNAATEEEVTMREIVSSIAHTLHLPGSPTAWPVEEARGPLGPLADGLASNKRISAARARRILGWRPHRAGLIEEIERGSYPAAFGIASGQNA